MKRATAFVGCLGVLLLYELSAPTGISAVGRARLLETGQFHGEEVSARTGERWLGLYVTKGRSSLTPSTLIVKRVHDPIVDTEPNQRTGKKVIVRRRPQPILLIKGGDRLRPGPITTLHAGRRGLKNRSIIPLKPAGRVYDLQVVTKGPAGEYITLDDAKLVLSRGETRQMLYSLEGKRGHLEGGEWNLLWAGDLDHDNKLDLYVQVSWRYNVSQRKLFLLSQAGRGQLVGEIASFETVGC